VQKHIEGDRMTVNVYIYSNFYKALYVHYKAIVNFKKQSIDENIVSLTTLIVYFGSQCLKDATYNHMNRPMLSRPRPVHACMNTANNIGFLRRFSRVSYFNGVYLVPANPSDCC